MSLLQAFIPSWSRAADPDALSLERARKGDKNAFDVLRRTHEGQLRGFVTRRGSPEYTDDLVQEIWIACWQSLPKYAGKARFKTWLYGIAAHKCTDFLRVKKQNDDRTQDIELVEPI